MIYRYDITTEALYAPEDSRDDVPGFETESESVGTRAEGGVLADIQTEQMEHMYNALSDFYTAAPSENRQELLKKVRDKKEAFKMPEIPEPLRKTVLKYGNRVAGIPNGRKQIDFDFED